MNIKLVYNDRIYSLTYYEINIVTYYTITLLSLIYRLEFNRVLESNILFKTNTIRKCVDTYIAGGLG